MHFNTFISFVIESLKSYKNALHFTKIDKGPEWPLLLLSSRASCTVKKGQKIQEQKAKRVLCKYYDNLSCKVYLKWQMGGKKNDSIRKACVKSSHRTLKEQV